MSTRCQIGIYEEDVYGDEDILNKWEVLLYRHSDGYPGVLAGGDKKGKIGVVPDILPFLKEFMKKRGYDVEYMGACLMAYMKHWHCGEKREHVARDISINGFECDPCCHGISKGFHGDIEYFYAIMPNGLRIYKVSGDEDFKFEQIESHDIKGE
jgi:hypothetical protein